MKTSGVNKDNFKDLDERFSHTEKKGATMTHWFLSQDIEHCGWGEVWGIEYISLLPLVGVPFGPCYTCYWLDLKRKVWWVTTILNIILKTVIPHEVGDRIPQLSFQEIYFEMSSLKTIFYKSS